MLDQGQEVAPGSQIDPYALCSHPEGIVVLLEIYINNTYIEISLIEGSNTVLERPSNVNESISSGS